MTNQQVINFLGQARKILLDDKSWLESAVQPINEAFDAAISALVAQDVPDTNVEESEWIKPLGMMPPEYHGHYECVKCGGWAMKEWGWHHRTILTKFCPHCGRPMKNGVNK